MLAVLSVTLPIFAIIALGFGLTKKGAFQPQDMRILGSFVVNVSFPALVFEAIATRDIAEVLNPSYLLVYAAAGLAMQAIAYGVTWAQRIGPARRAVAVMGTACPNSGYIVYPLLLMLAPDHAGLAVALNFVVENFLLIPVGLFLLELSRPRAARSPVKILGGILLSVLKRPFVTTLILGTIVVLLRIPVPEVVLRFCQILGAASAPVALFFIGGNMVGMTTKGEVGLAGQIAFGKLVIHPLLAVVMLGIPLALGLPMLSEEMRLAVLVTCSAPMLGILPILVAGYGHQGLASLSLVAATAASFLTLTIALALIV